MVLLEHEFQELQKRRTILADEWTTQCSLSTHLNRTPPLTGTDVTLMYGSR